MEYLDLNHQNQLKIGLIILSFAVTFMTVVTYGNYDAFFPRNIASLTDLINFGDGGSLTIIGYQSFSAIFCLLLGLSPEALLVIPIFIIPLFFISFLLLYRLSKNPILSALIVCSVFCYGTGSTNFIFWIHSHGRVLIFLLLLLFVLFFSKQGLTKSNTIAYFICAILIIASTNYSSYNYMAQMSLLMAATAGVMAVIWIRNRIIHIQSEYQYAVLPFIGITGIAGALVFLFSSFYKTFFGFIEKMAKSGVSSMDKILNTGSSASAVSPPTDAVVSSSPSAITDSISSIVNESIIPSVGESISSVANEILSASVLLPYYLSTESSGPTVISILRYLIIVFAILLYCFWLFTLYIRKESIHPLDAFLTAFLLMTGAYIFIRTVFVGQPTYNPILYPGILIIARLCTVSWNSSLSKIGKMLGIGFIITSVMVICLLFGVVDPVYDTEPNMIDAHPQTVQMGEWSYQYSANAIATDVYSEGTMCMSLALNHLLRAVDANRFAVFAEKGRAEILSLIHPERPGGDRDLVINYSLPYISAATSDWVTLIPWSRYEDRVMWSYGYNVVYGTGDVEYMTPLFI